MLIYKYLDKHNITNKKHKKTPISCNLDYTQKGNHNNPPIQEQLGSLRYSADHTRPDILAAIGIISSGMANPSDNDIAALKHIEQYLLYKPDLSLTLGGDPHVILIGFSDASYITRGDSKSRLAYCLFLNLTSGCIIAKSWKDSTISHSSTEAEIKAIDALIREIIWMRGYLHELGFTQHKPTVIYVDNEASIAIATYMSK